MFESLGAKFGTGGLICRETLMIRTSWQEVHRVADDRQTTSEGGVAVMASYMYFSAFAYWSRRTCVWLKLAHKQRWSSR